MQIHSVLFPAETAVLGKLSQAGHKVGVTQDAMTIEVTMEFTT